MAENENESGDDAQADAGDAKDQEAPAEKKPVNKTVIVLGGLGCAALMACCCFAGIAGQWMESQERRQRTGPPAVVRALADMAEERARDAEKKVESPSSRLEKTFMKVSAPIYRDAASRIRQGAETVTEGTLMAFLCEEQGRIDDALVVEMKKIVATLSPGKDREFMEEGIRELSVKNYEGFEQRVAEIRKELEEKYEAEKRSRGAFEGLAEPRAGGGSTAQLGEAVKTRYFEVTVRSCRTLSSVGSGPMASRAGSGNTYLVLSVTIKNTDTEGRMFIPGRLWATVGGRELEYDNPETVFARGYLVLQETLNPQTSWSGKIAWLVPSDLSGPVHWQPGRSDKRILVKK